jgi:hypothetical protein
LLFGAFHRTFSDRQWKWWTDTTLFYHPWRDEIKEDVEEIAIDFESAKTDQRKLNKYVSWLWLAFGFMWYVCSDPSARWLSLCNDARLGYRIAVCITCKAEPQPRPRWSESDRCSPYSSTLPNDGWRS